MVRGVNSSVVAACIAVATIALPAGSKGAAPSAHSAIAWQVASSDAEVDRAFALARQSGKPVFLYWGAVWCPPCNQVKATLFSRPDFVERTRAFVPVYVDGDKPGAQKVAARFKVSGYPTMVLFKPDGSEITRLPGEVDPERYLLTLNAGLNADVPVKDLATRALSHQPLTPEQWRLLAFYSWDTDDQQMFKTSELAPRLSELANAAPASAGPAKDRLMLKAIAARAKDGGKSVDERTRATDRTMIDKVLATPESVREQWDFVVFFAEPIVKYLAPAPDARADLARKWDASLQQLLAGGTLSRSDSVDALDARVDLWKAIDKTGKLSTERQQAARGELMRVVAQSTDRYERQAVVPSAAHVLASVGLVKESDEMLKAELPRAVAPYYHMLVLASNAKERGDKAEALHWYEQAWRKSEGPATRIQWGSGYVRQLVELAPQDSNRISLAAAAVMTGLEPRGETFFERNQRSLQKMAAQLQKWQGADPARVKVVAKLKDQLSRTCGKLPAKDAGRANCESVFNASKSDA
ncbi:MAG TPA: thioredoxin family protein [Ramlibacter sp.]|nr:thioredoxin family protein [Ramlibacter sp.]